MPADIKENLNILLDELEREQEKPTPSSKKPKVVRKKKASPTPTPPVDPNNLGPAPIKGVKSKEMADIEKRFLEVAGLEGYLDHFPIDKSNRLQVKTDKIKSAQHGEVFTPLWLVDEMIQHISEKEIKDRTKTYRDLCSGYGQFTVRLLRRKVNLLGSKFKLQDFLRNNHMFVEIQPNSCYRLLYVFGTGVTLAMGDAGKIGQIPENAEHGIWVWCEASECWKDMTGKIIKKFNTIHNKGGSHDIEKQSEQFESWFTNLQEKLKSRGKKR